MFTYYHLSCLWKFSFGGTLQESELTEQSLPLDFTVFMAHEQGELELSCNEMMCLAPGMAGISWKACFCLVLFTVLTIYLGFLFWFLESPFRISLLGELSKLKLKNFSMGLVFIKPGTGILEENTAFTFPPYLAPAWLLHNSAGVNSLANPSQWKPSKHWSTHEVLHHLLVKVVSCNNMA